MEARRAVKVGQGESKLMWLGVNVAAVYDRRHVCDAHRAPLQPNQDFTRTQSNEGGLAYAGPFARIRP